MSRLDLGASPNTVALALGLGLVALALPPPPARRVLARLRIAALCALAAGLAATQSRGALVALGAVAMAWMVFLRPSPLRPVLVLGAAGLLLLGWLACFGRASAGALQTGASVRAWVHGAALMQAGEAFFSTPVRMGGLAEDAALRYGFPLGLEQGRMIRGPLSTFLAWLDPVRWPAGLFQWLGVVAPACLWPFRRDKTSARPWRAALPASLALFTVVVALFNCVHQDWLGRKLLPLLALAGWAWLLALVARRDIRAVATALGAAALIALLLLGAGFALAKRNQARQGVERWSFARYPNSGDTGSAFQAATAVAAPLGTLLLFDHQSGATPLAWACRAALHRQAGRGWRIIVAPGAETGDALVRETLAAPPVVTLALGGPAPEPVVRAVRPAMLVTIDPGLVVWLTPDGAAPETDRHWIATQDRSATELDRAQARPRPADASFAPPVAHRLEGYSIGAWTRFFEQTLPALPPPPSSSSPAATP